MRPVRVRMATTVERADAAVSVSDSRLLVSNLAVSDPEIVSYFGGLAESEQLDRRLEQALRIGVLAITSTSASQNVNFVEKAFDAMRLEFDQKMDSIFDEKGPLSAVIARHFGDDGTVIREQLNPDREGSPLHTLRAYLDRTLAEIRDTLNARAAVREEAARGTQKGREFEEWCEAGLSQAARPHSDLVEKTGDVAGRAGKSKKGDFVATLDGGSNGGEARKIVFEMKDVGRIGPAAIKSELKEAMDNRGAAYGVLIARSRSSLHDSIGWFNEYDGNKLVCAVEDGDGNAALDGGMIQVAYKWARARAGDARETEVGEVDAALIEKKAKEISDHIGELKSIKRECTNIDKSSENIRGWAESAERGLKAKIDAVVESLRAG